MATVNSPSELKNLQKLAVKNAALFKNQVYLDGKNLTVSQTPTSCFSFLKRPKEKVKIEEVECNTEPRKFLCEFVEVVDDYKDEPVKLTDDKVEVKFTFFKHLGDYGK